MKLPLDIEPGRIRLENRIIHLDLGDRGPRVRLSDIPFRGDLPRGVGRESDQRKILHFLFTDKASGFADLRPHGNFFRPVLKSWLKGARAQHDPAPGRHVDLYPFTSLQSIQWHLLKHCFADHWRSRDKPRFLLSQFSRDDIEEKWRDFLAKRICPSWPSTDGLKAGGRAWPWNSDIPEKRGCMACVNNPRHGADAFIRCVRFFQSYRIPYLSAIKKWMVDTIQDNGNLLVYEGLRDAPTSGNRIARRHIHMVYGEVDDLYAYVCEPGRDGGIGVHLMIFERFGPTGGVGAAYRIKTAYGLAYAHSREGAKKRIHEDRTRLRKKRNPDEEACCHVVNWPPAGESLPDSPRAAIRMNSNRSTPRG